MLRGLIMLGEVTGVGIPKRPGLSSLGLFMLLFCMLDLQEIGGEEKQPFCRLLVSLQSYLPILASITLFQDSIVMLRRLQPVELLIIHVDPVLL